MGIGILTVITSMSGILSLIVVVVASIDVFCAHWWAQICKCSVGRVRSTLRWKGSAVRRIGI